MTEYTCIWLGRTCSKRQGDSCPHHSTQNNCKKRRRDMTKLFHNYKKAKDMYNNNPDVPAFKNELNKAKNELTLFLRHYKIEFTEEKYHPLYGE